MSAKSRLLLVGLLLPLFGQPAHTPAQEQGQAPPPPPLDPARFAGKRVHARALQIAAARQANPALFETIAPYYDPWDNPIERLSNSRYRSRRPVRWTMRPLGLDVLHGDYAIAAESYPEVVTAIRNAIRAWVDGATKALTDGGPSSRTLQDQYYDELNGIREAHELSWEEFHVIASAAGGGGGEDVRLNPKFRDAWEEALLRDIPWGAKLQFFRIVVSFDDEASIPVIGQVLRDSLETEHTKKNRNAVTICTRQAFDALVERVCSECLGELADTARSTTGTNGDGIRHGIAERIKESPEWGALVDNLETKGEALEDVALIRAVIEADKTYKRPFPTPPAKP